MVLPTALTDFVNGLIGTGAPFMASISSRVAALPNAPLPPWIRFLSFFSA